MAKELQFPVRINQYLAAHGYSTRRGADQLIEKKRVYINGRLAKLGDRVLATDQVEVRQGQNKTAYRYYAYHKPAGIITHSAQEDEEDIAMVVPIEGVFPVGRLDKASSGLIILTNDGRITDRLLNPEREHEKEYLVKTTTKLKTNFKRLMENGVNIEGYITAPCRVTIQSDNTFRIVLTEGKKHQIRRMCAALKYEVRDLKRVRVMNIKLGNLKPGTYRAIEKDEKEQFLSSLGL